MEMNASALAPDEGRADSAAERSSAPLALTGGIVGCAAVRPLVVLPTYNEALNIEEVIEKVRAAVPHAQILVVDDGSPDGTADLAEELGRELGNVSVLRRSGKAGLGSAYRTGFREGLARDQDVMIEMDSDLQHDPAALPSLLAAIDDGADLVIGSRYVAGGTIPDWALHRRLLSRWGNRYAGFVLGLPVRDVTAGFRAYRATALEKIDLDAVKADGYGFQIEMAYAVKRTGGRIVEVPISFRDRVRGTSKMSSRIVVEALGLVTWWGIRDRLLRRGKRATGA
jgi:dolichol-phosphate mannosyltransferase